MASRFESVCDSRLLGLLLCYGAVELVVHHLPLRMLPLHPVADGICLPPCTGMSETAPPDRDVAVAIQLYPFGRSTSFYRVPVATRFTISATAFHFFRIAGFFANLAGISPLCFMKSMNVSAKSSRVFVAA